LETKHGPEIFKAVIFDLDGTLVDSYGAITASVNHVRASHSLPPLMEAKVRRHVGRGPVHLISHTVPGADLAVDLDKYKAHHPSVLRSGTHLLPEVAETLQGLHACGFRLAVCSNKLKPFTRVLLEYFHLASLIEVVIGPEDARAPKPSPEMLLAALAQLRLAPPEALYVGDMVVDIETARSAGVTVWVIPTGSDDRAKLELARPDKILDRFSDLLPQPIG
jgi:phosphoglycolate phosphatase